MTLRAILLLLLLSLYPAAGALADPDAPVQPAVVESPRSGEARAPTTPEVDDDAESDPDTTTALQLQRWLLPVLVGIFTGLLSSAAFTALLFRLKPQLEISPWIAHESDAAGDFFVFKVVNRSSRPAINVRVDASLAKGVQVKGGINYWTTEISVVKPVVFELAGYDPKDQVGEFAQRFVTTEDIEGAWTEDHAMILFRVIATDSFSGFSRAYKQEYRTKRNSIRKGSHEFGLGLEVS